MLIKRSEGRAAKQRLADAYQGLSSGGLDRRAFLRQAGFAGAGLAALGSLAPGRAKAAGAATGVINHAQPVQRIKNICTHCSVGCTVTAEVQNGVWVGQEPTWESPINRGTHCAKGAAVRELVGGERLAGSLAAATLSSHERCLPLHALRDRRDWLHRRAARPGERPDPPARFPDIRSWQSPHRPCPPPYPETR